MVVPAQYAYTCRGIAWCSMLWELKHESPVLTGGVVVDASIVLALQKVKHEMPALTGE